MLKAFSFGCSGDCSQLFYYRFLFRWTMEDRVLSGRECWSAEKLPAHLRKVILEKQGFNPLISATQSDRYCTFSIRLFLAEYGENQTMSRVQTSICAINE